MNRVLQPQGLFVLAGGGDAVVRAARTWRDDHAVRGACGDLTLSQAQLGMQALQRATAPTLPQVPWAMAGIEADGTVVLSASPMLHSGLFWAATKDRFCAATDPGQVLAAGRSPATIDPDYLLDSLSRRPPADRTMFTGVNRLEPGFVARWMPGSSGIEKTQWSGPAVWEEPFREGPATVADYVAAFDRVVDDGVREDEPIVMLLSGGLDSTFVAASLARHARADRPVIGLVHRPSPHAHIPAQAGVEIDEWPFAQDLAAAYPGRIELVDLAVSEPTCTLDVALEGAQRSWTVTVNPANARWTSRARNLAIGVGATRLHTGSSGNFSFSWTHNYALAHFLRRGQMSAAHNLLATRAADKGWPATLRGAAAQVSVPVRRRDDGTREYVQAFGMDPDLVGWTRPHLSYRDFRESLSDLGVSNMGSANPARFRGLLDMDPFESPEMLRFAAQITIREWVSHPGPRGFARAACAGRVPDSIRLRRTRGGQSLDAWWAAQHHRRRYEDAAGAVADTPFLSDWIDTDSLVQRVCAWPWDQPVGPPALELAAVERLLHTAEFVRWVQAQPELSR